MKTKRITAIALTTLVVCTIHAQEHLVGVGILLKAENHAAKIEQVVPNSPASRAHLTTGLLVLKVDGSTPTDDTRLKDWANMIRGEPGTKVRLELLDPKKGETNTVELIRENVVTHPGTP